MGSFRFLFSLILIGFLEASIGSDAVVEEGGATESVGALGASAGAGAAEESWSFTLTGADDFLILIFIGVAAELAPNGVNHSYITHIPASSSRPGSWSWGCDGAKASCLAHC